MNRTDISNAVRDLREHLGDTQQSFAHRMGIAISTAVRYETGRAPKGRALADLAKLSEIKGTRALTEAFWQALRDELDTPYGIPPGKAYAA